MGPCSFHAIRFLSHSCDMGQKSFAEASLDLCSIPQPLPPPLLLPQPEKASLCLGFCHKLLKNKNKTKKRKRKKTQQDLQALLAAVKTNATTKMCQKAGGGWPGARWGAGKHGELACRQWEGAKYPHKQVSCLKLIYLLKQHSAKPVINIFLPRLLT